MKCKISVFLVVLASLSGFAQDLTRAGQFSSLDDEIQFLPGLLAVVQNDVTDGKSNVYAFQLGKFSKVKRKAPSPYRWNSFNWANIDFLDQIDRADFESESEAAFIPQGSKVKGFAYAAGTKRGETLVFVCYAVPTQSPITEEDRDLRIVMLRRGPISWNTKYEKLKDVLVAEGSYFGGLIVQRQPQGIFVVLYSVSQHTRSVDVYRVVSHSSLAQNQLSSSSGRGTR